MSKVVMKGVREYCEGDPVTLLDNTTFTDWNNYHQDEEGFDLPYEVKIDRPIIQAFNEGGHNSVEIDLIDLISWIKENKPELLEN